MPSAVVLAHTWIAGELGHLGPWLDDHGFTVHRLDRDAARTIPDADLLVAMGSPGSVVPDVCTPATRAEVAQVGEWVTRGRPYLGICFGAQVLARAMGGSVARMPTPFEGYVRLDVESTAPPPLAGPWTVWHNDGIAAPVASEVLGSLDHADLAFRTRSAWGVQPHIEVTADILARMAVALGSPPAVYEPIVAQLALDADGNTERARTLLDAFLEDVSAASS